MRILHTSDWHLGRQFHGLSLEADHAVVLNQVYDALITHKPHALIIAGDIYDRASPPASAVRQFNDFIKRVAADTNAAIVLIAGNHDSGDRIESMSIMTDPARALIRGPLIAEERPLILTDEDGPVAFSALPFGYEFAARECFDTDEIDCPADVIKAQLVAAKALIPKNSRWVVVAHAFVTGANPSDSERNLGRAVGGIETVSSDVFEDAHYVALGHLHRPQSCGEDRIRYSGSPIAFGFDESDAKKSMSLIELAGNGSITVNQIPFTPMRQVKTLRGKLSDLIASGVVSDDFVKIILTDTVMLIDPMKQVRELYPNACALSYERDETPYETKSASVVQAALTEPSAVIEEFLRHVRGAPQSEAETKIIEAQLKNFQTSEG